MVGAMLMACLLGAAALVVTAFIAAAHTTRGAADLVAISAAEAFKLGHAPCPVAREAALRNRVRLVGCQLAGDLLDFTVAVTVEGPAPLRLPGLPTTIRVDARAGRGQVGAGDPAGPPAVDTSPRGGD